MLRSNPSGAKHPARSERIAFARKAAFPHAPSFETAHTLTLHKLALEVLGFSAHCILLLLDRLSRSGRARCQLH
jgi:hypothetical protein